MSKISITIDVSKINKDKIVERVYTNGKGEKVVAKEYKMDIVPLNHVKVLKTGDGWVMKKTHFVTESKTKEEIANKVDDNFLGEGIVFESSKPAPQKSESKIDKVVADLQYPTDEPNPEDIPF